MWCSEVPLKEAFPLSYRIVREKDALVAEHLCVQMGLFIGMLFYYIYPNWELENLQHFFALLHSVNIGRSGEDGMV